MATANIETVVKPRFRKDLEMRPIFTVVIRRRLGITKEAVEESLQRQNAEGRFAGWTEQNLRENLDAEGELIAVQVITDIKGKPQNSAEWCAAQEGKLGVINWEAVLDFISRLIEMLMPFIIKQQDQPTAA